MQIDFTEGCLAMKIDPTGDLLNSFIDLSNVFVGVIAPIDLRVRTAAEVRDRVFEAFECIPIAQLGTIDDCGFATFCDGTSTSREMAFAKFRARVQGTAPASRALGSS